MNILRDVLQELLKMFLADARLSVSILVLVGFVAWLIRGTSAGSLLAGGVLLGGCLVILVMAACRQKVK
jgi:hypothetical protein